MKFGICASALLMIFVPMLLPALALSSWLTRARVNDARAELELRGERESMYLANASELALLVGDADALQRLAAINLDAPGAATAVLFFDAAGGVLAAGGAPMEVQLARQCWTHSRDCAGTGQRFLFDRAVHASDIGEDEAAYGIAKRAALAGPELIGRVVLSFDPRALAAIQRAMLLNSIAITGAALLIAAVLAQLFAQRLTAPIRRLSAVVARIRGGELSARTTPGGAGELRELEEGVNAMADRVEAASLEHNRRIDEATAELQYAMVELQHALAELQRALAERELRNLELDRALAHAEAAGRAKDMFLARMSHELRTPLTTVTGFAHLMHQSESPEQRADFYRAMAQSSGLLIKTVDDILNFVKLESGATHLERREFDLEGCVEDVVMMHALVANQKGLELVCHFGRGLPARVIGDSLRLSQVLGNLISNAIKFTHAGCVKVQVSGLPLASNEQHLLFEVRDTGIGIDPQGARYLLQPFTQADESMTRRFGGSGLGLAITARIVEACGGSITLDGAPGVGTRARVQIAFPVVAPQSADQTVRIDARVALLCCSDSPHRDVLQDYLERDFRNVDICNPLHNRSFADSEHTPDLLVAVKEDGSRWQAGHIPLLRLLPIEALTDSAQQYLADRLPLPTRRRELIAACMRLLPAGNRVAEPVAPPAAAERPRFALCCVVVEDNELNRRMIATRLRDFGLRVVEAPGGREALERLAEHEPDLLLLDVHMPDIDGITLAKQVRERHPELPVYALTANVIGSEEQALNEAGVREVLYKPVDEERLLAVLERHAPKPRRDVEILEHTGIAREEIATELERLCTLIGEAMAREDATTAADAAHQLLGAARMFTKGRLAEHCVAIETRLRAGDSIADEFVALRAALDRSSESAR